VKSEGSLDRAIRKRLVNTVLTYVVS